MTAAGAARPAPGLDAGRAFGRAALWVLLLLLVLPFHDVLVAGWNALRPWSDGAAVLAALAGLFVLAFTRERRERDPLLLPVLLLWGVAVASAVLNRLPPAQAAEGLREMLPYTAAGVAAARLCRPGDVEKFLATMVAAGTVLALYGILSFITFRAGGGLAAGPVSPRNAWETLFLYPYYSGAYPGGWRLVSTFMNDNYFGVWMAMLTPAAVALGGAARGRVRIGWYAAACVMLVAFTWTYSRSACLALAAAVGLLAWRSSRAALLILVPVLLAAPLFATAAETLRFTNVAGTEGGRVASVQSAARTMGTNPLLGLGPGTRGLADMNYAKIGSETGLLGLAAFGLLVFTALRPAFQVPGEDVSARRLADAILAGMVAVCAAAVGGEVWEVPQLAYYFWILAGLLVVVKRRASAGSP